MYLDMTFLLVTMATCYSFSNHIIIEGEEKQSNNCSQASRGAMHQSIVAPTPKPPGNSGGIHMSSPVILEISPRPQGQIQKEISPTSKASKEGGVYMTPGRLLPRSEFTPVPSHGSILVYMIPPQNVMPARVTPA